MTKRKVTFKGVNEDEEVRAKTRRFKENHSLDSDEEDERPFIMEDNESRLEEDDIEGQEEETLRNDDGIIVTPFNLKDELEEGHFDSQGNYIADRTEEGVTDGWLETVDWSDVKGKLTVPEIATPAEMKANDVTMMKRDMLPLMLAGETVLNAIRRLGGQKKPQSSADRWKKKKQTNSTDDEKRDENLTKMLQLTGLADGILQNGDFQIYEKTYEKLAFETKSQFDDVAAADDDDELEAAFKGSTGQTDSSADQSGESAHPASDVDEVMWEYKLENTEQSKIVATLPSSKMQSMQKSGVFKDGAYCRKSGTKGAFYSSNRIDFDLYV